MPPTGQHALIRVWLADRPGALGLVASRIGAVRGDIVSIDVLERENGIAVDEFAVKLPAVDVLDVLVREIEEVDGASVEEVRVVDHLPDARIDALTSAALLCEASETSQLLSGLVSHVVDEFIAGWAALVGAGSLLASSGDPPNDKVLHALATGLSASDAVSSGTAGPDDIAIARLAGHDAVLLLGRRGPPFRRRERSQILVLARIADRMWALLDPE